jgi:hypothetical protein
MLQAWVAFPIVLVALSLGLGFVVERFAGRPLPWPLLMPAGWAASIAIASVGVLLPWPRATVSLLAAIASFGLVSGLPRRFEPWAAGAAGAVLVCFGLPILASGKPTFAGYIKLDDTATFLSLADRAIEHGRSLAGLAPSSYEATLAVNLAHGYPLGSVLPLGVGHELVRTDAAWLYQPWLSLNAAVLALCLYQLASPLIIRRPLRAAVAGIAALSALLYGFAQWGGVKELVAAALLATAVALAAEVKPPYTVACLVPLAVACAALVDAVSLGGVVWLLPLVGMLLAPLRRLPRVALPAFGVAAVLAVPALAAASQFYRSSNRATFTDADELGNLIRPLHFVQVLGIWPSGDFRVDPASGAATVLLLTVTALAVAAGVTLAVVRRATGVLLALASALTGAVVFVVFGAPWLGAKALAIASPFLLLAAAVGCVGALPAPWARARVARFAEPARAAAAVLVIGGVAWSDALAYREVTLAPYSQLAELEQIGKRFAGEGPALMTEYQPYGARHFLRRLDAEGASELRRRPVLLRDGSTAAKGEYVDVDRVRLDDLLVYRTLVLRRSPTESRPPSPYRLAWAGRWYDVWTRTPGPALAEHSPLGNVLEPGGRAPCATVDRLAALGGVVAYPRPVNLVWALDGPSLPGGWRAQPGGAVIPTRAGTVTVAMHIPRRDRYAIWLGGSIRGRVTVTIDGRRVGAIERQLQNAGQWLRLGTNTIGAGTHRLSLSVSLGSLSPGTGGGLFPLGPLLLQPDRPTRLLAPRTPRALCGRTLDWVEALRPAAR